MSRFDGWELPYLREVLESGFRGSRNQFMVRRLEESFAAYVGARYAIACVNGTATMHMALMALGIGPGDEVVTTPLTYGSTTAAILHAGATPVYADVDPETWNLDPASVRERITSRTKAILAVSLYGLPFDARLGDFGVPVIDDAAEAIGSAVGHRRTGSRATFTSFSFEASKTLTCGEGGILTTNDERLAGLARSYGQLGYNLDPVEPGIDHTAVRFPDAVRHVRLGWNYRMSDLCAAVASAQVERAGKLIAQRQAAADAYRDAICGHDWLVPQAVPDGVMHGYWAYGLRLAHPTLDWLGFRQAICGAAGDTPYGAFRLSYQEPAFRAYAPDGACPVAERLQPVLYQFTTNEDAPRQAEALARAIAAVEAR